MSFDFIDRKFRPPKPPALEIITFTEHALRVPGRETESKNTSLIPPPVQP